VIVGASRNEVQRDALVIAGHGPFRALLTPVDRAVPSHLTPARRLGDRSIDRQIVEVQADHLVIAGQRGPQHLLTDPGVSPVLDVVGHDTGRVQSPMIEQCDEPAGLGGQAQVLAFPLLGLPVAEVVEHVHRAFAPARARSRATATTSRACRAPARPARPYRTGPSTHGQRRCRTHQAGSRSWQVLLPQEHVGSILVQRRQQGHHNDASCCHLCDAVQLSFYRRSTAAATPHDRTRPRPGRRGPTRVCAQRTRPGEPPAHRQRNRRVPVTAVPGGDQFVHTTPSVVQLGVSPIPTSSGLGAGVSPSRTRTPSTNRDPTRPPGRPG
jgi:hypothetical protein